MAKTDIQYAFRIVPIHTKNSSFYVFPGKVFTIMINVYPWALAVLLKYLNLFARVYSGICAQKACLIETSDPVLIF